MSEYEHINFWKKKLPVYELKFKGGSVNVKLVEASLFGNWVRITYFDEPEIIGLA